MGVIFGVWDKPDPGEGVNLSLKIQSQPTGYQSSQATINLNRLRTC